MILTLLVGFLWVLVSLAFFGAIMDGADEVQKRASWTQAPTPETNPAPDTNTNTQDDSALIAEIDSILTELDQRAALDATTAAEVDAAFKDCALSGWLAKGEPTPDIACKLARNGAPMIRTSRGRWVFANRDESVEVRRLYKSLALT